MSSIFRSLVMALWLIAATGLPVSAANFGLSGGDETQRPGPAVDDLFKGGDGEGLAPFQDPAIQRAPPLRQDDGSGGFAPAATPAPKTVELVYDGHAAADGRAARINLAIEPDGAVTGTITIQSVCEPNIHLGGADLTFNAQLSGTWESSDGSIDGTWSGIEHFCGTDVPNSGTLKFFRKVEAGANPVLHLRITGKNGRYGWNFPPTDRVYVTATGTAPSDEAEGQATKPDQPPVEGEPPPEDLDPERVSGIVILPPEMPVGVGARAELPQVYAILGDTADKVPVPFEAITWSTERGLSVDGGEFEVSSNSKDGDKLRFSVKVALSLTKVFTANGVVLVSSAQLGSIAGAVSFHYSSPLYRGDPRRPFRAEVELRPARGGPPLRRMTTGPDGSFRFDRLPQGGYQVVATTLRSDPFPTGYKLRAINGPWYGPTNWIPEERFAFKPDPETAVWDHTSAWIEIAVVGPDFDPPDAVTGRVLYHDQGVAGVTVRANRVGPEGGQTSVTSGKDGSYTLEIDDLEPGTYWLRAEKYVVARWAGPDDLLDVASARDQHSVLFTVPFFGVDEISIDIEVLTRNEIFGGERTPEQPVELP
jgi:hypothetical protein